MFSPSEGKVTGRLSGPHERGIKDFKFYGEDYLGGWSVGGDGKLVQWDLRTNQAIR
jgi:U3 small nucleolar RNA-associated protein 5